MGPLLLGAAHDGGDENFLGEIGFQPAEDVQILLEGAAGELLDVLKAVKGAIPLQRAVTGRGLSGDEVADGLEARPRPAQPESPGDFFIGAGHHRGRQQEGIFQLHPAEGAGQVHLAWGQVFHLGPVGPQGGTHTRWTLMGYARRRQAVSQGAWQVPQPPFSLRNGNLQRKNIRFSRERPHFITVNSALSIGPKDERTHPQRTTFTSPCHT